MEAYGVRHATIPEKLNKMHVCAENRYRINYSLSDRIVLVDVVCMHIKIVNKHFL